MVLSWYMRGLNIRLHWSVPLAIVAQIYFIAGLGIWHYNLDFVQAIFAATLAAVFYIVFAVVHQLGHALAARLVGHPMRGFRMLWWFNYSEYPLDEADDLPARVHIIRSFGGPIASGLMLLLAYWVFLVTRDPILVWLDYFGFLTLIYGIYFFAFSAVVTDGVLFLMMRGWRGKFLELGQTSHTESV